MLNYKTPQDVQGRGQTISLLKLSRSESHQCAVQYSSETAHEWQFIISQMVMFNSMESHCPPQQKGKACVNKTFSFYLFYSQPAVGCWSKCYNHCLTSSYKLMVHTRTVETNAVQRCKSAQSQQPKVKLVCHVQT